MSFDIAATWFGPGYDEPPLSPATSAPSATDHAGLAILIRELFAEGALSAEQLAVMIRSPELAPHFASWAAEPTLS